jgi:NADP-dependent 3-hydroxy acid dehydrogenase YdfG
MRGSCAVPERLVVVTGTGGAIGGAVARAFEDAGHHVMRVGRGEDPPTDLSLPEDVDGVCQRLAALERIDVLVHAAGAFTHGTIEEAGVDELLTSLSVNVLAPFALTQAALPALRAARGAVVFVGSSVVARPLHAGESAYAIGKHGLKALADVLRAEENRNGVSVLSIHPGRTAGPLQERLHAAEGRPYDAGSLLAPDDVARTILDCVSLPDSAEVTDVHIRPRRPPA